MYVIKNKEQHKVAIADKGFNWQRNMAHTTIK